jgi:hypothetical protein
MRALWLINRLPSMWNSDDLTFPVIRRDIKGRPFWSRVLSVRLEPNPLQKGAPSIWIA